MAARIRKIRHDDETRAKIKTSQLINRLENHVLNDLELKPTQVTAALGLLKKTLPDLTQSDVNHTVKNGPADYSREELVELLRNARNGSEGTSDEDGRGEQPDSVH